MGRPGRGLGGFGCSTEGAHFYWKILYKICKSAPADGEMVHMRIRIRPVESNDVKIKLHTSYCTQTDCIALRRVNAEE